MQIKRLILIIALLCAPALATTRYIAQTAGTFSGGTACNGHTTISAATFNTTTNTAGDVNYVCGTITSAGNTNVLTVLGSGTSSLPITLKFDTGASLQSPYCPTSGNSNGCLLLSTTTSPQSFILVDGGTPCGWNTATNTSEGACNGFIEATASGSGLANNDGDSNGIEALACTGCEVRNLGIYNMYVLNTGQTDTGADYTHENFITFSGTNFKLHDCQMHDAAWGVMYYATNGESGMQMYNNEIYNVSHAVYFSDVTAGVTASNGYIYGNYWHGFDKWNNTSDNYHIEGLHSSSNNTSSSFTGLYLYNNLIVDDSTNMYGAVYLSTTTSALSYVNQAHIFNNLIVLNAAIGEYGMVLTGNANSAYNNTVINLNAGNTGGGISWSDITANGYTFTYKNNLIQGFYMMIQDDDSGSEGGKITSDYNAYSQCPASGTPEGSCFQAYIPGGASNWSTFVTDSGETHSINSGLFLSTTCCSGTFGLNSSYAPQSTSAVRSAGANLYSTCNGQPNPGLGALCSDYLGVARPTSAAWDAGAIQYNSGTTSTTGAVVQGGVVAGGIIQ